MPKKYWCEYCGTTFHTKAAATRCTKLKACRGLGFPPRPVLGSCKVRTSAAILARTSGDMLKKSPIGRQSDKVQKMGQRIIDWADRAYKATEANTPISLGCATRLHKGLTDFVENHLWKNTARLPNLYVVEVADRYVFDAMELVKEIIDTGSHRKFWFQDKNPEWLLYDACSMPLAIYISQMKMRRQTSKILDQALTAYGHPDRPRNPKEVRPVEADMLGEMLDHCWRDELRAWRFLQGALATARKDILAHGTPESLDLTHYDPDDAYIALTDYIWAEEAPTQKKPALGGPLKLWLVDNRHWVAAKNRKRASLILTSDVGLVGKNVVGVSANKKLYDEHGVFVETAAEMVERYGKECYIGRT